MEKNNKFEVLKSLGIALVYISAAFVIVGNILDSTSGYGSGDDLAMTGGFGIFIAIIVFLTLLFTRKSNKSN